MDVNRQDISYVWYVAMGLVFFCLAALALLVDLSLAQTCREDSMLSGDVKAVVRLSEVFAHGGGVILILLCVWATMQVDRRKIIRVACCAFVPGLIVSFAKLVVGRSRPNSLSELPQRVSETFHGFFPAFQSAQAEAMLDRQFQSFPSGHSATAVGLAIGLSWLFPRGRWCFALFAALAMLQRIDTGAHFPSDTLVSAGLASLVAGRYVSRCWEGRLLGRFENQSNTAADLQGPSGEESIAA